MTIQDEHLETIFPEPPLVAYKRKNNLSDFWIMAKLPPAPGTHEKQKNKWHEEMQQMHNLSICEERKICERQNI